MQNKKLIIFGSINIDHVMRVKYLPKPGETVSGDDYAITPGGKGANQALAAALAGADTSIFGMVGDDSFGQIATKYLKQANVDLTGVSISKKPTGCASIWVDHAGENAIILSAGANGMVKQAIVPDAILTPNSLLLLQMEVSAKENWQLIKRARSNDCMIMLNSAPAGKIPDDILHNIDILLLNETEAMAIANDLSISDIATVKLPEILSKKYNLNCILTLGGKGVVAHLINEGNIEISALKLTPIDTTGAGDCFAGVLAAIYANGENLSTALQFATVAGGLQCLENGAQQHMPSLKTITANMNN